LQLEDLDFAVAARYKQSSAGGSFESDAARARRLSWHAANRLGTKDDQAGCWLSRAM
jgi:hypothetical protein